MIKEIIKVLYDCGTGCGHQHRTKELALECIAKRTKSGSIRSTKTERDDMIKQYRQSGKSIKEIGDHFRVSRSRIDQILHSMSIQEIFTRFVSEELQTYQQVEDIPIEIFLKFVPVRIRNCILNEKDRQQNIKTIGDIMIMGISKLLEIKNFGSQSVWELNQIIDKFKAVMNKQI